MATQRKFTPGPWVAIGTSVFTNEADEIRFRIASVLPNDDNEKDPVPLADANLIAAAPDLYAALRELIERRDRASAGKGERERDGSDGRYARARAALAKAEGRDAP